MKAESSTRDDGKRAFQRFAELAHKLVRVPKAEVDQKRSEAKSAKRTPKHT